MPIHVALLGMVLLCTGLFVGTKSSYFSDEGATIVQARMLARGEGWIDRPRLLTQVDPTEKWYGLESNDEGVGNGGFAPYAKHPFYALAAAGAFRAAGAAGVIGLSSIGVLLAALFSALIARHLKPELAIPTLWVVGIASPLFFDGFLAIGSTLEAAAGAAGVLIALNIATPVATGAKRTLPQKTVLVLAVGACFALATLIRTEGLLMAGALATVMMMSAVLQRRVALVAVAVSVLTSALLARTAEATVRTRILGNASAPRGFASALPASTVGSFVVGRWHAVYLGFLQPSHPVTPIGDQILVVTWALVAVLAVLIRVAGKRRDGRVTLVAAVLTLVVVSRLVLDHPAAIPGVLIGFPIAWGGCFLLHRRSLTGASGVCLLTAGLFLAAVVATEYDSGPILARFVVPAVPLAVPVLLVAWRAALVQLSETGRRGVGGAMVASTLVVTVVSLVGLRQIHEENRHLVSTIHHSAGARHATVVTLVPWLARLSWASYPDHDWLRVSIAELPEVGKRLHDHGLATMTLATVGSTDYARQITGWRVVSSSSVVAEGRSWRIWSLQDALAPDRASLR
ncbi:MAG: hypothetical protein NVSMB16_09400 [Acidimicrobiales bacterium]